MEIPKKVDSALARIKATWRAFEEMHDSLASLPEPSDVPTSFDDIGEREEYAVRMAQWARNARLAGELSFAQYVYSIEHWIVGIIHEGRWLDGHYTELESISEGIGRIEQEHGLQPEETWKVNEGPAEWNNLNEKYGKILDGKALETLREFGFDEVADLREGEPTRHEGLCERGRRAFFDLPGKATRLSTLAERYRREGDRAEEAGAFYAAVVMRGAALEALLLKAVLSNPHETRSAMQRLKSDLRPNRSNPERWGLHDLLTVSAAAGWLPNLETGDAVLDLQAFVMFGKDLRNLIHPGRHLKLPTSWSIEEAEATKLRDILTLVSWLLSHMTGDARNEELKTGS